MSLNLHSLSNRMERGSQHSCSPLLHFLSVALTFLLVALEEDLPLRFSKILAGGPLDRHLTPHTHQAATGFSFKIISLRNAAAFVRPSSGDSRLSSCSIDRTPS